MAHPSEFWDGREMYLQQLYLHIFIPLYRSALRMWWLESPCVADDDALFAVVWLQRGTDSQLTSDLPPFRQTTANNESLLIIRDMR